MYGDMKSVAEKKRTPEIARFMGLWEATAEGRKIFESIRCFSGMIDLHDTNYLKQPAEGKKLKVIFLIYIWAGFVELTLEKVASNVTEGSILNGS